MTTPSSICIRLPRTESSISARLEILALFEIINIAKGQIMRMLHLVQKQLSPKPATLYRRQDHPSAHPAHFPDDKTRRVDRTPCNHLLALEIRERSPLGQISYENFDLIIQPLPIA